MATANHSDKELTERIHKWLAKGTSLRILVAGVMGTGKSALVNGLIGTRIALEGDHLEAVTSAVRRYCSKIQGVDVTVFDTPGFSDPEREDVDTIKEMAESTRGCVDLILICIDMRVRVSQGDIDSMQKLTEVFGQDIWMNTIFVLTFANKVRIPRSSSETNLSTYFNKRLQQFRTMLQDYVASKCNIDPLTANKISVVPAGYLEASLPDREDWLTSFWTQAFERMSANAQPALLKITQDRVSAEPDRSEKPPSQRKIAINMSKIGKVLKSAGEIVLEIIRSSMPVIAIIGQLILAALPK